MTACSPFWAGAPIWRSVAARSSRLLVDVKDPAKVAEAALRKDAPRGAVQTAPTRWQIIVGPEAQSLAEKLGA